MKEEREEADKILSIVNFLKEKVLDEGKGQERRNKSLIANNQKLDDSITNKKGQLADLQAALERTYTVFDKADEELTLARDELEKVRKHRNELIT